MGSIRLSKTSNGRLRRQRARHGQQPAAPGTMTTDRAVGALIREGAELAEARRPDEAEACLRRALELAPTDPRAQFTLAGLLMNARGDAGSLREAQRLTDELRRRFPGLWAAEFNAAVVAYLLGDGERSDAHMGEALRLAPTVGPEAARVRLFAARRRLECGDLAAWPEYARLYFEVHPGFDSFSPTPTWDGSDPSGRRILIDYAGGGHGDLFMFVRFAPMLARMGATVLLRCRPSQARLLARCDGVAAVLASGDGGSVGEAPPDVLQHDLHIMACALPGFLSPSLDKIPAAVPYLSADAADVERWRPAMERIPGFRIGVAWQGDPTNELDRFRSFMLAELAPLAAVPGVSLISLQQGHGVEQLADAGFPVVDLGAEYAVGDWLDTAALISQLDLIVSCDSAIAHLSGAVGRPTWLALQEPSEFRWLRDRDDSPWYPTMRLFRQERPGDWSSVFRRMADALADGARAGCIKVISSP
jgi:hypothetical protein